MPDEMMGMVPPPPGAGAPGPGGPPPGAGGPPGPPPGAAPPGAPPGAGGGGQNPLEQIQAALTLLAIAGSQIGITETVHKAVNLVAKAIQNLTKNTPAGRQGAVDKGAVPPPPPPGVGAFPGANIS